MMVFAARNSVKLNIRRIQYASESDQVASPQTLVRKSFLACAGSIEVEAILDKLVCCSPLTYRTPATKI